MLLRSLILTLSLASARDLANCTRQRLCNGDYLCADVCKLGTVAADPHHLVEKPVAWAQQCAR